MQNQINAGGKPSLCHIDFGDETTTTTMAAYKDITLTLSDRVKLVVKTAKTGAPYLRFERDERPRVILFEESWKRLKEVSIQASAIFEGYGANLLTEWLLNDSPTSQQKLLATTFKDVTYVGIHTFDSDGNRVEGRAVNLNAEEWRKLVQMIGEVDTAMKMKTAGESAKGEVRTNL